MVKIVDVFQREIWVDSEYILVVEQMAPDSVYWRVGLRSGEQYTLKEEQARDVLNQLKTSDEEDDDVNE